MKCPLTCLTALGLLSILAAGCGEQTSATEAGQGRRLSQLAAADAFDGNIDQVVSRCASCSLNMAGQASHALTLDGYLMRFCTGGCKDLFAGDPDKILGRLETPAR